MGILRFVMGMKSVERKSLFRRFSLGRRSRSNRSSAMPEKRRPLVHPETAKISFIRRGLLGELVQFNTMAKRCRNCEKSFLTDLSPCDEFCSLDCRSATLIRCSS